MTPRTVRRARERYAVQMIKQRMREFKMFGPTWRTT